MTTQINQLTELTSTSDGDLLLIREASTGVDKKMQAVNLRAKATTKDDVGLGNVDNVSAASLRDRSTHTGTQPLSTISDAGTIASQDANSVNIDGGNIDGTAIGSASASSGAFTTLTASDDVNFDSGTLFVDASTSRVGIGTTTANAPLHIVSAQSTDANNSPDGSQIRVRDGDICIRAKGNSAGISGSTFGSQIFQGNAAGGDLEIFNARSGVNLVFGTNATERMRITSSGKLLVNSTASPISANIALGLKSLSTGGGGLQLTAGAVGAGGAAIFGSSGGGLEVFTHTGAMGSETYTERMRIDSSGRVGIGTTSPSSLLTLSASGAIQDFERSGVLQGRIRTYPAGVSIGNGNAGLKFVGSSNTVHPVNAETGANLDNQIDLGVGSIRFDDIYATNGTIQTSDANEKQDIEQLTEAEQRVAQKAKTLLRKFRWKSAVEEKGEDARIHFGIIAQDLMQAFKDEGLDIGRYAMFIKGEWWEDADGNQLAEYQDGAVKRERLGVRYSELLAFIISAI